MPISSTGRATSIPRPSGARSSTQVRTSLGAPGADSVTSIDGEPDVVSTGGGNDDVRADSSLSTTPVADPDTIDLGPGDDHVSVGGVLTAEMTVVGGDGTDAIDITLPGTDGWVVDAARGALLDGAAPRLAFSGLESYAAVTVSGGHWRFVGTDSAERVSSFAGELVTADLRGGDDALSIFQGLGTQRTKVLFDGGPGHDLLDARGPNLKKKDVSLDLRRGRLAIDDSATGRAERFEDADVTGAQVEVTGTRKGNSVVAESCRVATIRGLGGDDRLTLVRFNAHSCAHVVVRTAVGGGGDDVLTGTEDRDRLDGGPGRDRADGRGGRDLCPGVEIRKRCER